jgi:signal transduction histidine kinase
MTVRVRLLLTLGGIIMLLVIPAAYGVSQLRRLTDLAVELENVHGEDNRAVGQYRAALAELDRLLGIYLIEAREDALRGTHNELSQARRNLRPLRPAYPDAVEPTLALLDSLEVARDRITLLMEANDSEAASNYFNDHAKPLLDSARASIGPVLSAVEEKGRERVTQARRVSSAAARTTLLAATIAVLLTAVLGLWTTGALSRPLGRLSEATGAVAQGDFGSPPDLPYDRNDEIGYLSRSFESMTTQLAELDRLKAEFVSLASHELKTPINVIGGYTELLEEGLYGELTDRQREVLSLVRDQTRSLTLLVNQLLDLSRFEAGGLRVEPREVEIATLLHQVEGSFRALATQKQVEFDVTLESSLPEKATVDPDRLRHEVLGNLLSNAFKFTHSGGTIRLRAWSHNGEVRLSVADDGVGIPSDQLEHIFEKYYQVEGEGKDMGSGLGLAIAKHVVDAHGGSILATSNVGQGTEFEIRLPNPSSERDT